MRNLVSFLIVVSTILFVVAQKSTYDQVNVFIASGGPAYGYGSVNPGAQVPFGAMRLGPDTTLKAGDISFRHFSGYNAEDDTIRAFSHTHLVGAGIQDLGNIGVMPYNIHPNTTIQNAKNFWWSKFSKDSEIGKPGNYFVHLDEPDVDVELLALTNMAGLHRYTWKNLEPKSFQHPGLFIDPCHGTELNQEKDHSCKVASVSVDLNNPNKFHVAVSYGGGFTKGMWFYLSAEIVAESDGVHADTWKMCGGEKFSSLDCQSTSSMQTDKGKLYAMQSFNLDKKVLLQGSFTVQLRVGLSFISADVAEQNLKAAFQETTKLDSLRARTQSLWSSHLDRLSLSAIDGDKDITPMLYSALYRSLLSPTDYTEAGGLYFGADKQVHNVTAERSSIYGDSLTDGNSVYPARFFSDFSFWDTFRTLHPWQLLYDEQLAVGVARSVGEITIQQNAFPRWILGSQEESCMIGLSGSAFPLEAAMAGLQKEFDLPAIQQHLLVQSTQNVPMNGRTDVDFYMSHGYVPQDAAGDSAALTLTFAFDDFVLGRISQLVGDDANADAALARSKNYRNLWSPEAKIFCPRFASGEQVCPKSPVSYDSWQDFREGDALHYLYFVPQDPQGLVALFGSPAAFDDNLSSFLDNHVQFHEMFGSALPNPYYWAGNEHNHLSPFLFNYGSNCTKTQYWARRLTQMHFSNTPHGVPGNEDYGAMSTWLLFTSLGLFPVSGTTTFLVASPRVASASIRLNHWRRESTVLTVLAHDNSPENVYVSRVLVNGNAISEPFIDRSALVGSAEVKVEFFMTSNPVSEFCY